MKSKKVLSIEQMRRLQKLGVDTSTASWFYDLKYGGDLDVVKYPKRLSQYIQDGNGIGAFTLQDILEIMPVLYPTMKNGKRILVDSSREDSGCHYQPTIFHSEDGWFCSYFDSEELMDERTSDSYNNPLDAAYEMLCWCIENGYIKELKNE
ncbi:hypothetical protein AAAZ42_20010 [Bacteroides ovatus]|jgi:hypothetical protein|uniref:hypothetical protein n=1 Tax=Bacteroides ovatus TaxID=28116 RepID=UPI00247FBDB4|nr:hypothetical protein [Bacteroides ovatus]MDC2381305.1 hypothetical protein [Bacteroides ovatus]